MKEPSDTLPLDATASQAQLNASGDTNPTVVAEQKHAGAAVKAALIANIGVAIAKLAAAVFTGSSSMLSESVHSIADCSNEIVLIIGDKVSKHKLNSEHPFGWYRTKYLASFVVATLLFFVGGFFSTSEAVKKIIAVNGDPALQNANRMELVVALVVVVISACLEGYGLHQSVKEANERMKRTDTPKMGIFRFWKRTKSAELASVIMEDTLALIGLAFAFIGIGCAIIFDNELFDAIGGLMVGLLLVVGSLVLAYKSGSLLIGESVTPDTRERIVRAVEQTDGVEKLINMQTVHMSEDNILLCLKVQTSKLDRDYDVQTVDKIERNVRTALPWFNFEIYVEHAHSPATSSRYESFHRSSSPSGMSSTRSGRNASTAPSSWVTSTIAPSYFAMALRISWREAGSRLFVGSSSSSTLARDVTKVASANRVFSPPESTWVGLNASSPENRKDPRIERAWVSLSSGATLRRLSSTLTPMSRVSCSWAK